MDLPDPDFPQIITKFAIFYFFWLLNFSNSNIIDKHVEVYNNMAKYKTQKVLMTSGEELLSHHLNTNNIKYKSCNIDCKLIRANTGSNPGTWVNVNQLK